MTIFSEPRRNKTRSQPCRITLARELQGLLAIHNFCKSNYLRRAVISDESEELKRRREGAKLAREREILKEKGKVGKGEGRRGKKQEQKSNSTNEER